MRGSVWIRLAAGATAMLAAIAGCSSSGGDRATAAPSSAARAPACASGRLPVLRPYRDAAGRTLTPVCWQPVGGGSSLLYQVEFTTPYLVPNADDVSPDNPLVPRPVARILLPTGYFGAPTRRYPVIYLLHGGNDSQYVHPTATNRGNPDRGGGSYRAWTTPTVPSGEGGDLVTDLARTGSSDKAIVVMPEGGDDGWYSDWAHRASVHPLSPSYESFHVDQLVPWVDANLRTVGGPDSRAIVGLSMGGSGAVGYAERHPGLFRAVATFSGALDDEDTGAYGGFQRLTEGQLVAVGLTLDGDHGDPSDIWGPTWDATTLSGHGPGWDAHDVRKHIGGLAGTDLTIYSGAADPTAPAGTAARCLIHGPGLAAQLESAACGSAARFDLDVRASGVRLSHLTFQQFAGRVHDFAQWNDDLRRWLPHGLSVLSQAR